MRRSAAIPSIGTAPVAWAPSSQRWTASRCSRAAASVSAHHRLGVGARPLARGDIERGLQAHHVVDEATGERERVAGRAQ